MPGSSILGTGGFRIASGYADATDVFNTNVYNLTFNAQLFDFDFFVVPELGTTQGTLPLTFALLTLGLAAGKPSSRTKGGKC